MNIIVRTTSGKTVSRPDTTWERKNEDFFPPDCVTDLTFTPVLFCKVSKTGKSVAQRFASRYFEEVGCGILLYPENFIDGSAEGYAMASCLDHSSFLPTPLFQKTEIDSTHGLQICLADKSIYQGDPLDNALIEKTISEVTQTTYIRIGDYVVTELSPRLPLTKRADGTTHIVGIWNESRILDFRIVF